MRPGHEDRENVLALVHALHLGPRRNEARSRGPGEHAVRVVLGVTLP